MLDIECSSAPQFFGLPYLHMVVDEDNKIMAFSDRLPEFKRWAHARSTDQSRSRSLQLFPPHILPLCNVWQHLNTCAFQEMQLYASHQIALNKSRLKLLAHVSLNANYLLQAVSYCLHLIMCLCLKSSTLLFYSELKRHCLCTARTCHTCIIAWDIVIINRS